jgi:hypothetical protein
LQFTVDIWNPDAPIDEVPPLKAVKICRKKQFPYLDMEFFWRSKDLNFRVHMKPNQLLKYLNKGSAHTPDCFKAIPHGVLRRLVSLTTANPQTKNVPLNKLYADHCRALESAGLPVPKSYPTLREELNKIEEQVHMKPNQLLKYLNKGSAHTREQY